MKKTLATLLVVALVASLCGVMFVSAEETNIALGKEVLNAADRGSYNAKLTDGVALEELTYNAEDWFGFYWNPGMTPEQNAANKANAIDGIAKPTVDLGATASIDKVRVNLFDGSTSGIVTPESITLKVSTDNETYTDVAVKSFEWPEDGSQNVIWVEFALETPVDARYVQLEMKMRTTFVFINEIEVYEAAAADEPEVPAADPSVSAKVLDGSLKYTEADLAKLIDGNAATDATSFGDAGFVSFENTGFTHTDGVDAAVEATVELVLDLGAVKTLSNVTLNAFKDSNSMIALPTVKFYLSNDGENFYEINAGAAVAPKDDMAETATAALSPSFSNRIAVNARYVKAVCTFKNGWLFLSELSVTLSDNAGEDLDSKYAYTDSFMEAYCIGVYHPEDGELTLSQNGDGKMLKSAQLIKAAYDAEAGAYKVIYSKVNPWPAGHEGTETLAEGEILVAISTQGNLGTDAFSGAKWIARGLVEGDYVVLDDENKLLSFYPAFAFAAEEEPEEPSEPKTWEDSLTIGEDGNASVEVPYGFTWEVNYVDGKIGGEDVTICTTDDAYKACNPNWAITILLEKQEDGTYVAVADAVVTPGNADKVTVGENQIALVVHSASSNPDGGYANWTGKVVAVSVKAGDVFVINEEMTSVYAVIPGEDLTPDEPDAPVTGDAGVLVFAVLAVVAVVGCAVASKIKASAL